MSDESDFEYDAVEVANEGIFPLVDVYEEVRCSCLYIQVLKLTVITVLDHR